MMWSMERREKLLKLAEYMESHSGYNACWPEDDCFQDCIDNYRERKSEFFALIREIALEIDG